MSPYKTNEKDECNMSASSKKKLRKGEDGEYLNHKARIGKEEADKNRKFRRNSIIVTVIVVVLAICALLYNTNILYSKFTAVKIGDTGYSVAHYNYFAGATYYTNYYQSYYDGVEFTKEYEREAVLAAMKEHTALYDAAIEAGYSLTEEDIASVQESLDSIKVSAESSGYSNLAQYYAAAYGKGMNEKTYKALLEENAIVARYTTDLIEGYDFTQDEIDAQYELYADEFATVEYLYYKVSTSSDAYADFEDDAAKLAASKADADKIAEAKDTEEFASLIADAFDAEPSTQTTMGKNAYGTSKEWLYDSARKTNETYVYEESDGYMVMMFVSREDGYYNTANVRHILIKAVADDEGNYTDEALASAKEEIERIEALWQEDPTEENFSALAQEYSEDTGSNTNGGLYENVYKGQMVEEFNDFCFGDRTAGDTAIVYGSSSSYSGYHLIYYVGAGEVYADYLAVEDSSYGLKTETYSAYLESILANYDISKKLTLRLANSLATA